ncbi:uncharacterized protein LOC123412163 [Hordeum vulgare subsp. vulgare]|uniref:uncharacterized protein LOC123412163 n=1 Tax=Hordeum vulgare subsp. vulgare TaxID=112509 RepID=UPI001D1A3950|nr:uncharacterized protein LOC123412163 [Hordeum vulgare subsp. vulgare]
MPRKNKGWPTTSRHPFSFLSHATSPFLSFPSVCAPLGFPPPPPPSPSHQPVPVPSVAGYRRRRLPQIRFSLKPSRLPFPPILHDGWEERGRGKGWHRGVARGRELHRCRLRRRGAFFMFRSASVFLPIVCWAWDLLVWEKSKRHSLLCKKILCGSYFDQHLKIAKARNRAQIHCRIPLPGPAIAQ